MSPDVVVVEANALETVQDCQLNVYNFDAMLSEPPRNYAALRFDSNNTCNLHCVYCHNHRSDAIIEADRFGEFLYTRVGTVDAFQVGCIMEPTLDKRLSDMMLQIADSPARPKFDFILQTNGILLHRHDQEKMRRAGLSRLSVSMDAADPATQKELRNGTSLEKVIRNIREFMVACPETTVELITTVTRANLDKMDELVVVGLELGIHRFIFREVFYYPESDVVDHARMPNLVLRPGEFRGMMDRVLGRFDGMSNFVFADNHTLHESAKRMIAESKYVARELGALFSEAS